MTTVSNGIFRPFAFSVIFSWPERCLLLKTPLPFPLRPWAETAKSASRLPVLAVLEAALAMSPAVVDELAAAAPGRDDGDRSRQHEPAHQ